MVLSNSPWVKPCGFEPIFLSEHGSFPWFAHKMYFGFSVNPLEVSGLYVRVSEQESIERALKRFKKQVQKAGILSDYRRKKFFESAGERRKRKAAAARRRQVKRMSHREF